MANLDGRAPKDPEHRRGHTGRHELDSIVQRPVIALMDQPSLAELIGPLNPMTRLEWTVPTLMFWDALRTWPTTENLRGPQWIALARLMMLDDQMMRGIAKVGAITEWRQQLSKFGVAPDDMQRRRVFIATPDEAETPAMETASKSRYGPLRAVANE